MRVGDGGKRSFLRSDDGFVVVFVAALMLPLFGLLGLAFDLGRSWLLEERLRQATDLAAIYGAQRLEASDAEAQTAAFFRANLPSGASGAIPSVSIDLPSSSVTVSAGVRVPTTFSVVIGLSGMDLRARAKASRTGTVPDYRFRLVN